MASSTGDPGSHPELPDVQKISRTSSGTLMCLSDTSCPPCGTASPYFYLGSHDPTAEPPLATPKTSGKPQQALDLPAAQEVSRASSGIPRCLPDHAWSPDGTASAPFYQESIGTPVEPSLAMASNPGDPGSHSEVPHVQKNSRTSPGTPMCLPDISCLPLISIWGVLNPQLGHLWPLPRPLGSPSKPQTFLPPRKSEKLPLVLPGAPQTTPGLLMGPLQTHFIRRALGLQLSPV